MALSQASSFAIESWIWYGFAMSILLLRLASKIEKGRRHLLECMQIDDYLMIVTACFYTANVTVFNFFVKLPVLPTYTGGAPLSPQAASLYVSGSRYAIAVEQLQIGTIWLVKACLLILYDRLTRSMRYRNLAVRIIAVYCILGLIVMEVLFFGVWCRPFSDYWNPYQLNLQCYTLEHHLITEAVINLSSEVAVLCIIPTMFVRANYPLRQKLGLCGVFSLGIFVIFCAAASKEYSLTDPFGSKWENWYIRESSTAVIVANLPLTAPMMRFFLGRFRKLTTMTRSPCTCASKYTSCTACTACTATTHRGRQKGSNLSSNLALRRHQDQFGQSLDDTPGQYDPYELPAAELHYLGLGAPGDLESIGSVEETSIGSSKRSSNVSEARLEGEV